MEDQVHTMRYFSYIFIDPFNLSQLNKETVQFLFSFYSIVFRLFEDRKCEDFIELIISIGRMFLKLNLRD
jgi:hypothetical protein